MENQCLSLYNDIVNICGCRPTTTVTRTDATISDLLYAKVGPAFNGSATRENNARVYLLNQNQDTYFNAAKAYATDAEIIQRYQLLVALYKMNLSRLINGTAWECSWSFVECEYGQVTSFKLSK